MTAGTLKPNQQMTILVDQREKRPYDFASIAATSHVLPFTVEPDFLATGDYQLELPDEITDAGRIVVERKSLADLYTTLGKGRGRFGREVERMAGYGYAAIVVEATSREILTPNDHLRHETRLSPRSVLATLNAWSQRYGVHVWMMPGRRAAEQWTFRLLERWARDH